VENAVSSRAIKSIRNTKRGRLGLAPVDQRCSDKK
jgi:hypothetical protein